jgi:S-adenosylmethionine hydrolase
VGAGLACTPKSGSEFYLSWDKIQTVNDFLVPITQAIMSAAIPILTLTTDFGTKDGFVGTLKGVIWNICPAAKIADISHEISPQNILEGALTLWRAYSFFPPGTIHVAVVDPGVGTSRRPLAARLGGHTFVGPDNGLFTPVYDDAQKNGWLVDMVHLTNGKYFLPEVSRTFHARDIFAPVAAHLANGELLVDMGPIITDPTRLALPKSEKTARGWRAHISLIDAFGNCTTDLPASALPAGNACHLHIRGREIHGLVDSYGHQKSGELVALLDSENYVEIAVVNGNAALVLGTHVGDVVEVILM